MKVVLIFLAPILTFCDAFRVFEVEGAETLLALENEEVNIECKADTAMAYCGFVHPSGKRFSFSGASLEAGQCSYKINMTAGDSGQWRCHIGRKGSTGLEIMKFINVRVTSQLAAIKQNISTVHGKEVTLSCTTVDGRAPLRYCRFEPPAGKPFSINSDVTPEKPILKRFYFPHNMSLDRGDCAVSIRKVKYEDVGRWSCGAGLDDGKEHLDTILLQVEGLYTMSTASATGITFGAIGIAVFLAILGFVVWKKRRFLGSVPDENEHELQRLPTHRSLESTNEPSSRQGSTYELSSRQGSARELRPPPSSTFKPKSHQGYDLGTRQGSARELRPQPGSAFESKSRQGSTHYLGTQEMSQPGLFHKLTPHQGSTYEPRAPGSVFKSKSHQASVHDLGITKSQMDSSYAPTSRQGAVDEPSAPQGSVHDDSIRRISLHGSLLMEHLMDKANNKGAEDEPSAPQGSVHDEPILRISLHGSPLMDAPTMEHFIDKENNKVAVVEPSAPQGSVDDEPIHRISLHGYPLMDAPLMEHLIDKGAVDEPSAPQGSVYDEPIHRIFLHGSPLTDPPSMEHLIYKENNKSAVDEPSAPQGSVHDEPIHRISLHGSPLMDPPSMEHLIDKEINEGAVEEPSAPQGSVHDEPIHRISLH